ncbi:glycoside hydrolase family 27 protein [Treponema sp. J25]|uniref:glycoside hydrolase family 27 protein n=1 Tax=Treponema sp. J25 TaxID=2094121 RepID=UPI00104C86FC|nr:glycoside hydrolase family 27 protein [Treponema sp. J25]TCW61217.1 alpha-galactosidase [Treponema sp. J25]
MNQRRTPGDNLALTPPMGWNSYNTFCCEPTEDLLKEIATAMVDQGLKDAGYIYVNIDDGWMTDKRDNSGNLTVDPHKFPAGLLPVTRHIHSLGLKAGIYLGAGLRTYGEKMGSYGHEAQDAAFIAAMEFDFLKYDYRSLPDEDPPGRDVRREYEYMRDCLIATGRAMVFSICEHGRSNPWEWGPFVGHLWRSTPDIKDGFDGEIKWGWGFNKIADINERLYPYAGPGHWNDPDMLIVGLNGRLEWQGPGCTYEEYRSHFALWCLMAAPLIIGCDVRFMDTVTRSILLNRGLIAVNQDPLGIQGRVVQRGQGYDIWIKKLMNNAWAIGLYNRSEEARIISVDFRDLDFSAKKLYKCTDLWQNTEVGIVKEGLSQVVGSHDCLVFRLEAV